MLLESARALKAELLNGIVAQTATSSMIRSLAIRTQALGSESEAMRSIAIGIAPARRQHRLAVRVQRRVLLDHPILERIRKRAKKEVDIRYVGRINKLESPATLQRKRRPLVIGCSLGHYRITAGTLGCFVRSRTSGTTLVLSNNHVLANENDAQVGDPILQPGAIDGGTNPAGVVATLVAFVQMRSTQTNLVDCAVAEPAAGVRFNHRRLGTFGNLGGIGPGFLDVGAAVKKVGRTTGETRGRVTAFELDNVVVGYDIGNIRFDDQIEIEGGGAQAFSDGGDSGSLIVDADNMGVGLLFAGGDSGGTNGMGLTYANPLKAVLDALQVDLLF